MATKRRFRTGSKPLLPLRRCAETRPRTRLQPPYRDAGFFSVASGQWPLCQSRQIMLQLQRIRTFRPSSRNVHGAANAIDRSLCPRRLRFQCVIMLGAMVHRRPVRREYRPNIGRITCQKDYVALVQLSAFLNLSRGGGGIRRAGCNGPPQ